MDSFCSACRNAVLQEIRRILKQHPWNHPELDELVLATPLRDELRPAVCIAIARALGASEDAVVTSASVLELLHASTQQRAHRLPVADGMVALSLLAMVDNLDGVGLRASLAVYRTLARMMWTTVGGTDASLLAAVDVACAVAAAPPEIHEVLKMYARHVAVREGELAARALEACGDALLPGPSREFLFEVARSRR